MTPARISITTILALLASGATPARAGEKTEPSHDGKPLSFWTKQLKSTVERDRWSAADAVAEIGPAAASAIPLLTEAMGDKDVVFSAKASLALSEIGPLAIPALTEALKHENPNVCWQA